MANISWSQDTSSVSGVCFTSFLMFNPYNMTDRPDSVQPLWTFLVVVNGIASPVTVVINALIIWAILGDEEIRSYTFNLLLAALAVTDFFVGLVVEPLFILNFDSLFQDSYSPCFTTAYISVASLWCVETLVTLLVASVERYLAIEHPYFYQADSSRRKVVVVTAVMWVIAPAIVMSSTLLLRKHNPDLFKVPLMAFLCVCGLIVFYCTAKVFIVAYRHSRTVAVLVDAAQPQPNGANKEYKRAFSFTILVLASVIFYCPFIVVTAIEIIQGENTTDFFRYSSVAISATFIHIQSLVNPIIMSLRLSYIRQRIKNKLLCFN